MRGLVLKKIDGPLLMNDVATAKTAPHDALVRVRDVGVFGAGSKIRAERMGLGLLPLIMGHEVTGEVEDVGCNVIAV